GEARHLVSSNGTAGHAAQRIKEFSYPWPAGALLIMHSDGLGSRWRLDRYPGLRERHPALVTGVLYRDWSRSGDDVTVVAARLRRP
ncbi:MAG TPA: serine/threonine protein kinase, partial [Methylomirabilota bacterium]